jgi:cobalt-precorrin-5B (C1)-methyltransferase
MKDHLDDSIIICPGNYGRDYAEAQGLNEKSLLKISNFVGFFLERLVENDIKNVLFIGHIGKLIKVASGNFNTHSKVSDSRIETLVAYGAKHGLKQDIIKKIFESVTTDGALEHLLKAIDREVFFQEIVDRIKEKMEGYVYNDLTVEVIMFSNQHGLLGQTKGAQVLIDEKFK